MILKVVSANNKAIIFGMKLSKTATLFNKFLMSPFSKISNDKATKRTLYDKFLGLGFSKTLQISFLENHVKQTNP